MCEKRVWKVEFLHDTPPMNSTIETVNSARIKTDHFHRGNRNAVSD